MEKYQSKQHTIRRPAAQVYGVLSDFRNFTPIVQGRVEDWQATENSCSFKLKGFTLRLSIVDKEPASYIKLKGEDGSPLDFTFWIQMKEAAPYDTRFRLVLHADLNVMTKMMIGSKLQEGLDQMALQMANAFNGIIPEGIDPAEFMASNFPDSDSANNIPVEVTAQEIESEDFDFPLPDPNKPVS